MSRENDEVDFPDSNTYCRFANDPAGETSVSAEQAKLAVNQQQLKAAWNCSSVTSRGEWLDWMKRLGNDFMRESPSQAIRASRNLAEVYQPFAKELFNVAFVSCWTELYESYQEDLVHNLEAALTSPGVSPDVVNIILNLAEFMEHDDKHLNIDAKLLADYVSTIAKASAELSRQRTSMPTQKRCTTKKPNSSPTHPP